MNSIIIGLDIFLVRSQSMTKHLSGSCKQIRALASEYSLTKFVQDLSHMLYNFEEKEFTLQTISEGRRDDIYSIP